ncbi:MAG: phosphatase PAP2 family protein, partial [Verrucomicrobia bacterium]|nr:phosphatase PAP2 family protein [Verrucomicrobiota bacterium]
MHWLQTLDAELFRFINLTLVNPLFDVGMPLASHNALFGPLLVLAVVLLLWKGGARGALCILMLALILPLGDGMVCNTLKHAIERPRPYAALPDVHRPGTNPSYDSMAPPPPSQETPAAPRAYPPGSLTSMPSAHAANWFAATMILFIYYRRSVWFMLPAAIVVGFSRIYNGVHYPGDVLVGAILGAGYAATGVRTLNARWQWAGQKWFPLWWTALPSLMAPPRRTESAEEEEFPPEDSAPHANVDQHWLRLGYIWIAACLLGRLAYIASKIIQLSEDEAYQWLWSKHLALSYYSKPPLIAYTQFLGTSLWGDTPFGIRFFAPVIAAILSLVLLRFFAREVNARAGFFLLLIIRATPLMSA